MQLPQWKADLHAPLQCDNPVLTLDILHSGETFCAAIDTITNLECVNAYLMAALEVINPTQHYLLEMLWQKMCKKENVQWMFDSINSKLAYEGQEVVFNQESFNHWD